MICLVNPSQRMLDYGEPFHISSPGKQDLEYKIITFKIFRVRKTKPSVYKQNLYRFPLPETAVPHPPAFVRWYRFRLSPGRQPLVNNLLILIHASGYPIRSSLTDQTSKVIPSLIEPVPPRQNCSKGFFSKLSVSGTVPVYASISPASTCSFI